MKQKTKLYGAYGSNMNLQQMSQRCPRAKIIGRTVLENYRLTFRGRFRGVANVEPCEGYSVPLVLWELTEDCEKALNLYEGFPRVYGQTKVEVMVDETLTPVMIYVMTEDYKDMPAAPTEYYFAVIARGYSDNDINLKTLQIAYSECLREIGESE